MAFEAIVNRGGVHKVVLQERPEGVYVYAFPGPENRRLLSDHLQDDLAMAKSCSADLYGTTEDMWREVPDTGLR
jgi:hypothetical protein